MRTFGLIFLFSIHFIAIFQAWALEPYQPQSHTSPFDLVDSSAVRKCRPDTTDTTSTETSFKLVGIFSFSHQIWAFIRSQQGAVQQLQQGDLILNSTKQVIALDVRGLIYRFQDACNQTQHKRLTMKP